MAAARCVAEGGRVGLTVMGVSASNEVVFDVGFSMDRNPGVIGAGVVVQGGERGEVVEGSDRGRRDFEGSERGGYWTLEGRVTFAKSLFDEFAAYDLGEHVGLLAVVVSGLLGSKSFEVVAAVVDCFQLNVAKLGAGGSELVNDVWEVGGASV